MISHPRLRNGQPGKPFFLILLILGTVDKLLGLLLIGFVSAAEGWREVVPVIWGLHAEPAPHLLEFSPELACKIGCQRKIYVKPAYISPPK